MVAPSRCFAKNEDDARFALYYVNGQAEEFQRRTKELHEARMELKGLFSSHGGVMVGTWLVWKHLDLFNASIDEFWNACAFLPPNAQFDSADFLPVFFSRYDEQRTIDAHNIYEKLIREGAPHAGLVHGILTQADMPLTFAAVFSLFRHQKLMRHGVNVIAEAKSRPVEIE